MSNRLIEIKKLKKHFPINKDEVVKAVDDISLYINEGETFGLVGESGSGKSTLGKTIVGLHKITSGEVFYQKQNVDELSKAESKRINREMQIIFQDPQSSLNPRMRVDDIIAEGIDAHKLYTGQARKDRIYELLEQVGLSKDHVRRYPHEFSGGQRQRIGIARALAVNPKFIVADEPVSALDVSVQAQVINLLEDLKEKEGLTYLFIAHDLSVVKHISDRIGVMYLGKMMEVADRNTLYEEPLHPYTQALLSAISVANPNTNKKDRIVLKGDPPNPANPPSGCRFRTRCQFAMDICSKQEPKWKEIKENHWTACHLY